MAQADAGRAHDARDRSLRLRVRRLRALGGRRPFARESAAAEAAAHAHRRRRPLRRAACPPPSTRSSPAGSRSVPRIDPRAAPRSSPSCARWPEQPSAVTTTVAPTIVLPPAVRHRTAPRRVVLAGAAAGLLAIPAPRRRGHSPSRGRAGEPHGGGHRDATGRDGQAHGDRKRHGHRRAVRERGRGRDSGNGAPGRQARARAGLRSATRVPAAPAGGRERRAPLLESAVSKLQGTLDARRGVRVVQPRSRAILAGHLRRRRGASSTARRRCREAEEDRQVAQAGREALLAALGVRRQSGTSSMRGTTTASSDPISRSTRAGAPTATTPAGRSRVTTAPAPTTRCPRRS